LAGPGDEGGIAAVHVLSWQAAYRGQIPDDFLDSLSVEQRAQTWAEVIALSDPPKKVCLVAEVDDEIVGFADLSPSRDDRAAPSTGELTAIYVLAGHWGHGVGRALADRAIAELTAAGFSDATLWVLTTNTRARRFYEASGWTPDGATQVSDRGTFSLSEVRYRRELP
jgi:GNAT superfamily N-acetyltransferase